LFSFQIIEYVQTNYVSGSELHICSLCVFFPFSIIIPLKMKFKIYQGLNQIKEKQLIIFHRRSFDVMYFPKTD